MKIDITSIKVPINAVQADIGFEPHKLEVVDVSTEDSFANIFIQKEINNEVGYVRLTGGLPNPGFFADRGVFGTVFFKGISPGIVRIEFLPSFRNSLNFLTPSSPLKGGVTLYNNPSDLSIMALLHNRWCGVTPQVILILPLAFSTNSMDSGQEI